LSKNTEKSATGFTKKWIQSTPVFSTSATELLSRRTGGFKAFLYRSRRSSAALTQPIFHLAEKNLRPLFPLLSLMVPGD